MKTRTLLIAAVMFLGLTAAAFAQATYSVGSIPVTAVINTGQVELTGDITFSQLNNGNFSALGTITITYPVPITVGISAANPGTSGVRISNQSGFVLSAVNPPTVTTSLGILSVSSGATTGQGQVVIQVPAGVGPTSSFTLTGVRVAVAGTSLTNLSASVSTTNNAITAGQTSVVVINSIAAGLSAASTSANVAGSINAVLGTVTTQPVLNVKEGFLNAWGDPAVSTAGGIRITVSSNPPAGITVRFPAAATTATAAWQTINSDGTVNNGTVDITSTSTSLQVFYRAVSANDPTSQETLAINPTLIVSSSATLPLPAYTMTYIVSMGPIGNAFGTSNAYIAAPMIPRYAASDIPTTSPPTVFSIAGLTTTLLVPFAQTVTASGYNTGFAVSNTTEDPGTAMGFGSTASPVAQSGTITFYFYPALPSPTATNPTNFTYSPTSTVGHGLDANSKLISGGTYVVLLSELLAAAGQPADFVGYVFIVTNFTNAHAFWTMSNFSTFSQGGYALVITASRNTTTVESLNN